MIRGTMKKMYSNLFVENRNLIAELVKRNNNHEALLAELKKVNNYINKAANLRCNIFVGSIQMNYFDNRWYTEERNCYSVQTSH